jgi:aspartate aminotransferase-like enzyme
MDMQTAINVGASAVLAVIGWFARRLYEATEQLRKDVHQIEVDLPKHYVLKDEFNDNIKEVKEMLGKIFDKLDGKADKHP